MLHVQPSKESDVSRYRHGCDPPRATYPDLTPPVQILTLWPFLILIWLTVWLSAVPLSHIHIPDTTDDWSVLHSGGAHTVFTPDLPGEFSCSDHDNVVHLSRRVMNSSELGFARLNDLSKDRQVGKCLSLALSYPTWSSCDLHPGQSVLKVQQVNEALLTMKIFMAGRRERWSWPPFAPTWVCERLPVRAAWLVSHGIAEGAASNFICGNATPITGNDARRMYAK